MTGEWWNRATKVAKWKSEQLHVSHLLVRPSAAPVRLTGPQNREQWFSSFYRASAYWRATLIQQICLSVRLSVTFQYQMKTVEHIVIVYSPHGSPIILVLPASNIFTKFRRGHTLRPSFRTVRLTQMSRWRHYNDVEYLRNWTRWRQSYNEEVQMWTYTMPCTTALFRIISSFLAKYSMTWSIARSLCDRWASCRKWYGSNRGLRDKKTPEGSGKSPGRGLGGGEMKPIVNLCC